MNYVTMKKISCHKCHSAGHNFSIKFFSGFFQMFWQFPKPWHMWHFLHTIPINSWFWISPLIILLQLNPWLAFKAHHKISLCFQKRFIWHFSITTFTKFRPISPFKLSPGRVLSFFLIIFINHTLSLLNNCVVSQFNLFLKNLIHERRQWRRGRWKLHLEWFLSLHLAY